MTAEKDITEMRARFLASISHDFRTPLTAILLSTELLETYGNNCSEEKKREYIRCIRESAEQINRLLNETLVNYGEE